jgi:hypothetical protein
MRSLAATGLALLVIACRGGGGGGSSGSGGIPPAIAAMAKDRGAEVTKYTGWQVPGITLYRIVVTADDLSDVSVVGVDDKTGAVVQGSDLVRRMGNLPPAELAERVNDVLLGGGDRPLSPADERNSLVTELEWTAVAAPAVDGNTLVFFAMRGEMRPELYEYRVALDTFEVKMQSAVDVLVARGQTVPVGSASCEPLQLCGCWNGCARFQQVRVPDATAPVWHRIDTTPPEPYVRLDCTGPTCTQWCAADTAQARCQPVLRTEQVKCDESCPPSEAPYHCDTYADRCEQVAHPKRAAAVP